MRKRRSFTREFKLQAVRMMTKQGLSMAEVARDLDVGQTLLRKCKKQFEEQAAEAFPGNGKLSAEQEELRRLREEVKQLRMEPDILNKATAFFAKESK